MKLKAKLGRLIPDPEGRYKTHPKDSIEAWRVSDGRHAINVIFGNQRDCESMVRELAKRGITTWSEYDKAKLTRPRIWKECIATALKW